MRATMRASWNMQFDWVVAEAARRSRASPISGSGWSVVGYMYHLSDVGARPERGASVLARPGMAPDTDPAEDARRAAIVRFGSSGHTGLVTGTAERLDASGALGFRHDVSPD